jgi:hypothetical protein
MNFKSQNSNITTIIYKVHKLVQTLFRKLIKLFSGVLQPCDERRGVAGGAAWRLGRRSRRRTVREGARTVRRAWARRGGGRGSTEVGTDGCGTTGLGGASADSSGEADTTGMGWHGTVDGEERLRPGRGGATWLRRCGAAPADSELKWGR